MFVALLLFRGSLRRQRFIAQHSIPLTYKGRRLDARYQIDLIVEDLVVVEIKAVTTLLPVYAAQTLSARSDCSSTSTSLR